MRKLNKTMLLGAAFLLLAGGKLLAQPGGPGGASMDPQQMQQRANQFFKDQLVVTNDEEWSVIEPRITKVTALKAESMMSMMSGMGGMRGMMGGGRGGNAQAGGGRRTAGGGGAFGAFGQPSPEAGALQLAIDNHASKDELKVAMTKLRDSRKRKQTELTAAQDQLREVLSVRQEAILVSVGLLD